jgi:hypothetical protein
MLSELRSLMEGAPEAVVDRPLGPFGSLDMGLPPSVGDCRKPTAVLLDLVCL